MNDMQPLATEPILQGVFWSWILPAALFTVAFVATWKLYQHFSNPREDDR